MSHPLSPPIRARLKNANSPMYSTCSEYACQCHSQMPDLLAELDRLHALADERDVTTRCALRARAEMEAKLQQSAANEAKRIEGIDELLARAQENLRRSDVAMKELSLHAAEMRAERDRFEAELNETRLHLAHSRELRRQAAAELFTAKKQLEALSKGLANLPDGYPLPIPHMPEPQHDVRPSGHAPFRPSFDATADLNAVSVIGPLPIVPSGFDFPKRAPADRIAEGDAGKVGAVAPGEPIVTPYGEPATEGPGGSGEPLPTRTGYRRPNSSPVSPVAPEGDVMNSGLAERLMRGDVVPARSFTHKGMAVDEYLLDDHPNKRLLWVRQGCLTKTVVERGEHKGDSAPIFHCTFDPTFAGAEEAAREDVRREFEAHYHARVAEHDAVDAAAKRGASELNPTRQ